MTERATAPEAHVVVVGGSAGSIEALSNFVGSLPRSFPCPVVVVVHVPSGGVSVLPDILRRAGVLPADHAVDGAELRPGHILVAPPNRHVLLADATVQLSSGPRVNGHRPAVDPLFRSAARAYGPRAVGVILSGLDDGADGLAAIARAHGHTLVQSPDSALFDSMPRNALAGTGAAAGVPP